MNISESNIALETKEDIKISSKNTYKKEIVILSSKVFRRSIDIICGIVGTIILILIFPIVYIINKISNDSGTIFYIQERIGLNGKKFKMYKFRTMIENADERLKELLEEDEKLRKEYKEYKKLKEDPRITKVGKFLRKSSLDEFPQFINILKGEMTIVGPRPYLEREKEDMGEAYNTIIRYKPGLTGMWQISGRSSVTFQDRLDIDIDYCNNRSIKGDTKIFFKTIAKTIIKEGAE